MKNKQSKAGGKREGAGRHLKYNEPLKSVTVQVPETKVKEFKKIHRVFMDDILVTLKIKHL